MNTLSPEKSIVPRRRRSKISPPAKAPAVAQVNAAPLPAAPAAAPVAMSAPAPAVPPTVASSK